MLMSFLFGATYFFSKEYIVFDAVSGLIFVVIIALLVLKNRKKLSFQKLIWPVIYAVLWRTKFGLKFMDKVANKYREFIKLLGYSFIGFAFLGMILISINFIFLLFNLIIKPKEASQGVSLVLPLTNIPGIGYLFFWHFILSIFIIALIHEFAHGIMARAHKVPIKASGLGVFSLILPIFPVAFVEPDEKKLEKEKDVVQYSVFAAGPMANILLAFIILMALPYVANPFQLSPFEGTITEPIGISYTEVTPGYGAEEVGMLPGAVINGVNGKEALDYESFSKELGDLKPDDEVIINTLDDTYTIKAKASSDDASRGLIGIQSIKNERRVKNEFESIKMPYYWLRSFIRWLFYLNFFIGIINLLPLMITDGGRMLKVALERTITDKKKANKVWVYIGLVFIFTLLFALLLRYGLSIFSFIGVG